MYSLLLALIYIAFISLGLPDSLLGSGWPVIHNDLNIPISFMGIVSMVISGGTIVSSLLSDKLTRKLGTRIVTVISVFLTAIALFGFSLSNQFWMLIVFAIPYGLGAGAIDAALNNYVALHYSSKHMSWLHCFWGVGTIVSPFVMSYALTNSTWNNGYRIVSFIQLGIGTLLLATLPVWKANGQNVEDNSKSIGLIDALKIKGVPYLLMGFFAYCAAEATAMYWASTYLVEVRGITTERAAQFASLFYIGLTVGRFLSGFIMNKFGDRKMIIFGTCFLSCGIISLLIPKGNPIVSLVGFIIIGFGCAPIYPCIIHSTPNNFGAENSGAIIGIQMASAYVGSTFIPPLFGLLGNLISFKILPIYLLVFIIIMISMIELTFRITTKKGNNA
ncbi:MAG: MFS transporter [Clostridium sartagoforme]|nr:MFS transporter [Clostridium sartagoforme]